MSYEDSGFLGDAGLGCDNAPNPELPPIPARAPVEPPKAGCFALSEVSADTLANGGGAAKLVCPELPKGAPMGAEGNPIPVGALVSAGYIPELDCSDFLESSSFLSGLVNTGVVLTGGVSFPKIDEFLIAKAAGAEVASFSGYFFSKLLVTGAD